MGGTNLIKKFFKDLKESGLNSQKISAQIYELLEITGDYQNPDKISQKDSLKESDLNENEEEPKKMIHKQIVF